MKARLTAWQQIKLALGLGRWRVVYERDHLRSRPMCARVAKAYARMFQGYVEPTSAPILDLGLR